jgi:hypothetical protein
MLVTVTLGALSLNAIGAALDERKDRLSRDIGRLITQPESLDRDFAIECNRDALRDTILTQLIVAAAIVDAEEDHGGDHFAGMPATGSGIVLGGQTYEGMD